MGKDVRVKSLVWGSFSRLMVYMSALRISTAGENQMIYLDVFIKMDLIKT